MKNTIIIKNIACCLILLTALLFQACDDDESFDVMGNPNNIVYMMDHSTEYKIIQTPVRCISNIDFKTSLKCTQKASETIKVKVEVDNSMIEAYNKENETSYDAMPSSVISLENATMTIPAGEMITEDTLGLTLIDNQTELTSLTSKNGYLIPLKISVAEGGGAKASTKYYTTYLTVTVTDENINHDATESDINGTLVADQSGWTASTNGSVASWNDPVSSIFDGDMTTSCFINSINDDLYLQINMGQQYTFSAITFYYGYDYGDWGSYIYNSLTDGMTIYTSDNGADWSFVGKIESSSKYCIFYAPITAQYIKITTSDSAITGGIFNVYAE